MIYALDTNIITYILKNDIEVVMQYRKETREGNGFIIPPIVFYEVQRGLLAREIQTKLQAFKSFCKKIPVGDISLPVLLKAAKIYALLHQQGNLIEDSDIFIAAYCIINDFTLVTNNTRHFERIDGLKLVNWKKWITPGGKA